MVRRRNKLSGEFTVLRYLYQHQSQRKPIVSDRINMATLRHMLLREYVSLANGIVKITPKGKARWLALNNQRNDKHSQIADMYHAKQD